MRATVIVAVLLVAGCSSTRERPAPAPATTSPAASSARGAASASASSSLSAPQIALAAPATSASATGAPLVALTAVPSGVQYMCVIGSGSDRRQTAIEFAPKVAELCRRHPEMGPCQYQREACRSAGGRVFAADGNEITRSIEAEYDKRVMRIRLRGD